MVPRQEDEVSRPEKPFAAVDADFAFAAFAPEKHPALDFRIQDELSRREAGIVRIEDDGLFRIGAGVFTHSQIIALKQPLLKLSCKK